MARTVAIGEQDFSKIIENNYFYVDKTSFIKEWWENGDEVTLIMRPRRFGKTLAVRMTEQFFSVKYAGRSDLFENLHIWKDQAYRELQGTYPVIFLSFAGIKGNDYQTVREKICQLIVNLYADHKYLVHSGFLEDEELAYFKKISADMNDAAAAFSLGQLSRYLYHYYGKKVIILLDEYDTPMQEAYVNGYWPQFIEFIRGLFNAAFKTNPYLERAVMTGITRVSKESVFSELNNPAVVTTTSRKYETSFGFTEDEVFRALKEFDLEDQADEVKRWYDGFRFGDQESIYNPWSITQFLDEKVFKAYWANTSSNKLVGKLIQEGSRNIKIIVEDLWNNLPFSAFIDEQIIFDQLDQSENAIWSLLLASGYLKVVGYEVDDPALGNEGLKYKLVFTNLEIRIVFQRIIQGWFEVCSSSYHDFMEALRINDIESMNEYMNRIALTVTSSFDSGKEPSGQAQPEKFYHGFVLGMMLSLDHRYVMTSNRENGFGRYDVLLEPKNSADDAMIFEFKVFNPRKDSSLEDTVQTAIRQIIDKKYAAALEAKGISGDRIRIYGFAFQGKEVLIDGGYLDAFSRTHLKGCT